MTLKELRKQKKLTQIECAKYLGIPVRTYQNYENDKTKMNSMKYEFMIKKFDAELLPYEEYKNIVT